MKDTELKLIRELARNSRRSHKELAKAIGVSQPQVNRMIKKLEKDGYIQEYTIIPGFEKLGYKILAFTSARAKFTLSPEEQELARKNVLANPKVLFIASAEGEGKNGIMISLHRDFRDFRNFMNKLRFETGKFMENVETMLVSLDSSTIVKQFSLVKAIEEK